MQGRTPIDASPASERPAFRRGPCGVFRRTLAMKLVLALVIVCASLLWANSPAHAQEGGFSPSELEGSGDEVSQSPEEAGEQLRREGGSYMESTTSTPEDTSSPETSTMETTETTTPAAKPTDGGSAPNGYLSETGGPQQAGLGTLTVAIAAAGGGILLTLMVVGRQRPETGRANAQADAKAEARADTSGSRPGVLRRLSEGASSIRFALPGIIAVARRRRSRRRGGPRR